MTTNYIPKKDTSYSQYSLGTKTVFELSCETSEVILKIMNESNISVFFII